MLPFAGKNRVTSIFGTRTINGRASNHKGLDIVGNESHDVLAVSGGKVIQSKIVTDKSNSTWEWGNYVCVQAADGNSYYYCHMISRAVNAGDVVKEGDKIGVMGNTGKSFGAHLHFEIRSSAKTSINPCDVMNIPNKAGIYTCGGNPPVSSVATADASTSGSGKKLKVFGVSKGINVQAFTGKDVNLIAKDSAKQDIKVADGEYDVLKLEGEGGGHQWCCINYCGKSLFIPYGGVLEDRCQIK